ncbi:MAG: ribonuclease E/G [Rhodospirillales bacterium]
MSGGVRLVIESRPGELRAAVLDSTNTPIAFHVEREVHRSQIGALYLGRVAAVRPSLGAAFIDLGLGIDGFLNLKTTDRDARGERIVEGASVLVQIMRDAGGEKGPALGTAIDIAGRALLLTPGRPGLGLSGKIRDEEQRQRLKAVFADTEVSAAGLVVRTAATKRSDAEVLDELQALNKRWQSMQDDVQGRPAPFLIAPAPGLLERLLAQHGGAGIRDILLDDAVLAARLKDGLAGTPDGSQPALLLTAARTAAFADAGLEDAFEAALSPLVPMPGGGTLIITETPAMTTIDVNAGRGAAGDEERLALETNLQAAAALARQLRLRGIGGLIAVDFLKMRLDGNRKKVLAALKADFRDDPGAPRVGDFSPFGIVDIVRRSLSVSLGALFFETHRSPTPETVALQALARVHRQGGAAASLKVHVDVAAQFAGPLATVRKALEETLGFVIRVEVSNTAGIETVEIEG